MLLKSECFLIYSRQRRQQKRANEQKVLLPGFIVFLCYICISCIWYIPQI